MWAVLEWSVAEDFSYFLEKVYGPYENRDNAEADQELLAMEADGTLYNIIQLEPPPWL